MSEEPGRRSLLGMLAVFAALTVVVLATSLVAGAVKGRDAGPARGGPGEAAPEEPQPEVLAFLGPLASGERFGEIRIARVEPVRRGRLTLELEDAQGGRVTVDVHARAANAPAGVAETSRLALYVRSGRAGEATPAAAVRACTALATALQAREEAGHTPPPLDSLAPR